MALISVGASAQTTWNVRGMFGMTTDDLGDSSIGAGGLFQANISFKRGGNWIFSPQHSVRMNLMMEEVLLFSLLAWAIKQKLVKT